MHHQPWERNDYSREAGLPSTQPDWLIPQTQGQIQNKFQNIAYTTLKEENEKQKVPFHFSWELSSVEDSQ